MYDHADLPQHTSLLGALLQVILQFTQIRLKVLTSTHIEELLLIACQLLLFASNLSCTVTLVLLSGCQLLTVC